MHFLSWGFIQFSWKGAIFHIFLVTELDYSFQMVFKKMVAVTDLYLMACEKGHVLFSNKTQKSPLYAPLFSFLPVGCSQWLSLWQWQSQKMEEVSVPWSLIEENHLLTWPEELPWTVRSIRGKLLLGHCVFGVYFPHSVLYPNTSDWFQGHTWSLRGYNFEVSPDLGVKYYDLPTNLKPEGNWILSTAIMNFMGLEKC